MSEQKPSNKEYYENLLKAGFYKGDGNQIGEDGTEVVDVVTEYEWALNPPKETKAEDLAPVPFVYAIEYKQKYGATTTNLMNNIFAISNTLSNVVGNGANALSNVYTKVKSTVTSALTEMGADGVANWANDAMTTVGNFANIVSGNVKEINSKYVTNNLSTVFTNSKSTLLSPYNTLYALEQTKKKFCFPLLTENSAGLNISNSFDSNGSVGLFSAGISKTIDDLATGMIGFAGDVQDISNAISSAVSGNNKQFVMYNIEKAKAFSFPTTGKTLSVKFPLFNTTKKDAWKDNYKFIILFALRNMLFRDDNVTYYPPLIYDVSSPGWGRMPLSYVKQFTVKPVGMVRTLSYNSSDLGVVETSKNTTVNVPELWIVEIQFMSLIADSANQFLSSIVDLPINSKVSNI